VINGVRAFTFSDPHSETFCRKDDPTNRFGMVCKHLF
jgi:hypothetical protein